MSTESSCVFQFDFQNDLPMLTSLDPSEELRWRTQELLAAAWTTTEGSAGRAPRLGPAWTTGSVSMASVAFNARKVNENETPCLKITQFLPQDTPPSLPNSTLSCPFPTPCPSPDSNLSSPALTAFHALYSMACPTPLFMNNMG